MGDLFDVAQADKLLTTTRSVRKRLDLTRPVPRDVVLECITLACQAPTGGNIQHWRWVVVDDPALKETVAGFYRRSFVPYMATQRKAVEKLGRNDRTMTNIIDSSTYLAEHLHEVPVLVIPCMLDRVPAGVKQGLLAGYYGSILPAVWSFSLALRSRGLGSAWTTLHLEYEDEVADVLGIPHTVTQVALLPVAYTIGDQFKPGSRRDAGEVTYWNGWKTR